MRTRVIFGLLTLAAAGAIAPAASAQTAPPAPPATPRAHAAVTVSAVSGSYLGIGGADIDSERAKALNLKEERGAEITHVYEDSPAAKAGLKEKDVVLEFAGQAVQGMEQLKRMVGETPVGRQVKIVVWRAGASQTLAATIGTPKGQMMLTAPEPGTGTWSLRDMPKVEGWSIPQMDVPSFAMTWQSPRLGVLGEPLSQWDQLGEFFGAKDGVLVKSVMRNSPAEKAGIKAGDVIVKVNDARISTTDDISRTLRALQSGKTTCVVTVIRGKKETPVTVTLEARTGGWIRAVISVNC